MPFPFLAAATALTAIPGIAALFRRRPGAPDIPDFEDLTPGMRARLLEQLRAGVGRRERDVLRQTRQDAAARGTYRSGQLPALEARIRSAASEDLQSAETGIDLAELEARRNYATQVASLREGRYQQRLGEYLGGQQAGGQALGTAALNALLLARGRGSGGDGRGMLSMRSVNVPRYGG